MGDIRHDFEIFAGPGTAYVILPLYSPRGRQNRKVYERSGINQWNASGRERSFGEAYIPVPKAIHDRFPNFFPSRFSKFKIKLPDVRIVTASLCQSEGKALMSDPNKDICDWLFRLIDESSAAMRGRFSRGIPYKYDDLKKIGTDSVRISKAAASTHDYELAVMPLGSYEQFRDRFLS
jgi:hypothetical protein